MTYATMFHIDERDQSDTSRRLTLVGELDIASAPELTERLQELGSEHRAVRLDLSQLEFMDSTGIATILLGLSKATHNGWSLEIDPDVSPQIGRLITITGLGRQLWPSGERQSRTAA